MNPVAIRLLNQQLIVPQFKSPTEVVSHMGAMQAQEYRMMRWAVEMRTTKPSHKAFKEDCQADFFDGSNNMEELQEAWDQYQRFRNR